MAYETLSLSVTDHVAKVQLNRPEALNTMTLPFWHDMVAVFSEIDSRSDVRAVVVTSTGKHFTAGLDLSALSALEVDGSDVGRRAEYVRRLVRDLQESFSVIDRCRVPVIAAVQGACIGGGVDMVSACDMRLASQDAFFCIQEINLGIVADVGTLQRLPHLIPAGLVRELAYTGRRLPADEARAAGLVNDVLENHESLREAAIAMARTIADKSPLAITGTKEMLNFARDHTIQDGLNYVATWQAGMFQTEDIARQVAANQAKEKATFDDLLAPPRIATKGS